MLLHACRGIALLLVLLAVGRASADPLREEQAKQLYQEGKKAYDAGDYQRAYDSFRKAYRTLPTPALLYNIASALQGLDRPHDAADTLRAYLRAVPDDPDKPAIEGRIRALEESQRLLDEEHAAAERSKPRPAPAPAPVVAAPAPAPPPVVPSPATVSAPAVVAPPPATPSHPGRTKTIAGAVVAGVGALALVGGLVASLSARSAADQVAGEAAAGQPFDPAVEQAGKRDDAIAAAMYGIGAAAVVTGVVVIVLGRRDASRARAQITPSVGPGRAALTVGGHF